MAPSAGTILYTRNCSDIEWYSFQYEPWYCNRYSGQAKGWTTNESRFSSKQQQQILFFCKGQNRLWGPYRLL